MHVHAYPIDDSLTPDEAWKELCIFGQRITDTGDETWGVIRCDGEECANIKEAVGA